MPFKTHLMIISLIALAIFVAWRIFSYSSVDSSPVAAAPSLYSIHISHASWGLNCRYRYRDSFYDDGFADDGNADELIPDNALAAVRALCDGKPSCQIPVGSQLVGRNLAPECATKQLEVEYRCFSYDRPWRLRKTSGILSIDCENR